MQLAYKLPVYSVHQFCVFPDPVYQDKSCPGKSEKVVSHSYPGVLPEKAGRKLTSHNTKGDHHDFRRGKRGSSKKQPVGDGKYGKSRKGRCAMMWYRS